MVYTGNCPRCGKEVIREFKTNSDMKKFKGFCSRECANSRLVTEEHRKKTSETLKRTLFEQGKLLCEHGCGQVARFPGNETRKYCCSESHNQCPKRIKEISEGLKKAYIEGRKESLKMHPAAGWNRFKLAKPDEEIFKPGNHREQVKKRFLQRVDLKCSICGIEEWMGMRIHLHMDHINGDGRDHRFENLRLLCPNCHSQTETYCRDNVGKKNKKNENGMPIKVSDSEIFEALKISSSIRQTAIKLGLDECQGWTYERIRRVMKEKQFEFRSK